MTIVEIMKDKKRLYNGVPFRRKNRGHLSFLIRWNEDYGFEKISPNGEVQHYDFIPDNLLADDWEWVEEWYEGDFKKKYPNGVLCWVWDFTDDYDSKKVNVHQEIIIDTYIDREGNRVFKSRYRTFKYVKPIEPEEAPTIIEQE